MLNFDQLPKEVQEKAIARSIQATGCCITSAKERLRRSLTGGFVFSKTIEGEYFWKRIFIEGRIEEYYELYPLIEKKTKINLFKK